MADSPPTPSWLAPFARITSSQTFLPQIDGLRFVAIGAVILSHVRLETSKVLAPLPNAPAEAMASLWSKGTFGVQLFFVISGFIIALPFARAFADQGAVSLKHYYTRRLTRIEPPYLICLCLYFFLKAVVLGVEGLLPHFGASLLYLHGAIFGTLSKINGVTWSLEVEVQFYLLAPLLVRILRFANPWARRLLLVGAILGLGAAHDPLTSTHLRHLYLLPQLPYFLVGFLLVDVYLNEWRGAPERARSLAWDAVGALAWVGLCLHLCSERPTTALLALLVFLASASALRGRASAWVFSRPLIYRIGGMCYSIYLYHNLVVRGLFVKGWLPGLVLDTFGAAAYYPLMSLMSFAAILPPTALAFVLFERPFMRRDWPTRLLSALKLREPKSGSVAKTPSQDPKR